jgi:hypothetical protein
LIALISPTLINIIDYFSFDSLADEAGVYSRLQWVKGQSTLFPAPLFFSEVYFAINNMGLLPKLVIFIYALILLFIINLKRISKDALAFFMIILVFLFIHTKGKEILPLEIINYLFAESALYALRSFDKIHTFYPFFVLALFLFLLNDCNSKRKIWISAIFLLVIHVGSSYPLITGGIKTKYDLVIAEGDTYKNSEFLMIKKTSTDYENIRSILNNKKDYDIYSVVNVPFTGMNSPNWANYQKSKHIGYDPYIQLFRHRIVSLNDLATQFIRYMGRNWNQSKEEDYWYLLIGKMFSSKYMIYHKDIYDFLLEEGNKKVEHMLTNKMIKQIYSGNDIDLFEIKPPFINEIIFVPDLLVNIYSDPSADIREILSNRYKDLMDKDFVIDFQSRLKEQDGVKAKLLTLNIDGKTTVKSIDKVSNTRYRVQINNLNEMFYLAFSQQFDRFWKLKCNNCENDFITEKKKFNGFANGWLVSTEEQDLDLEIIFSKQGYVEILFLFSIVFLTLSILLGGAIRKNIK